MAASRFLVAALAIVAITVIAYWPSLSVPFQFDDWARISGNRHLHRGEWLAATGQLGGARVLPAATLVFNFWLSGEETQSYHIVNLALHLAATAAVFWLSWLLAATPRVVAAGAPDRLTLAAAAAVFFACHPLQTQAVTYIIQRSTVMATVFYIGCVSAYLAGRLAQRGGLAPAARRWFAAALVSAAAALLSKENAVTLPLALVLAEIACFGRKQVGRLIKVELLAVPFLALPVAWKIVDWRARHPETASGGLLRQVFDAVFAQGSELSGALSPLQYLLTQMLVLPRYLRLLILPVGLNVDHDVRVATGLDAGVVAGALLLSSLLALGVWALRRAPVAGFGILWSFVALSVESSVIPIHDVMMEHRMYLAMPGPALLFAAGVTYLHQRSRRTAIALVVGATALLAVITFERNRVWQSALSLWSDAAAKSPNKARVHVNAGVAHHGLDELDEAIRHYCRALEIDPKIALAADNIEIALEQQGRLDDVLSRLRPRRVEVPGAPEGTITLEYDLPSVVCQPSSD